MRRKILLLAVMFVLTGLSFFGGCTNVEGELYRLDEAYANGWLSQEDLQNISFYYNGTEYTDFVPAPKNPAVLSKDTEKKIKKTHLRKLKKDMPDATVDNIEIAAYYGTYGDCVAVYVRDDLIMYDLLFSEKEIIGGVEFYNYCAGLISVWTSN